MVSDPVTQATAQGLLLAPIAPTEISVSTFFRLSTKLALPKALISAGSQAFINGSREVDIVDVAADAFTAPGLGSTVGSIFDIRPFSKSNQLRVVGLNKSVEQSSIDFITNYIGGKVGENINLSSKSSSNLLKENAIYSGTQTPITFGSQKLNQLLIEKYDKEK